MASTDNGQEGIGMFEPDALLIEKAGIALLSAAGDGPCFLSGPLGRPYETLKLAVFRGDEGKALAARARSERRFACAGRDHRVIADVSDRLDCEAALVVEAA